MSVLEIPWQRLRVLALWGCVDKNGFQVKTRYLLLVVLGDFHGEQAVGWSVVNIERCVTATNNDLGKKISL